MEGRRRGGNEKIDSLAELEILNEGYRAGGGLIVLRIFFINIDQ